jgi:hypothetical protein
VCNERNSRTVYAPFTAIADPALAEGVRAQMEACIARASEVQPDLR